MCAANTTSLRAWRDAAVQRACVPQPPGVEQLHAPPVDSRFPSTCQPRKPLARTPLPIAQVQVFSRFPLAGLSLQPLFASHCRMHAPAVAACAIVTVPNGLGDAPRAHSGPARRANGMTVFCGVKRRFASLAAANRFVDFPRAER